MTRTHNVSVQISRYADPVLQERRDVEAYTEGICMRKKNKKIVIWHQANFRDIRSEYFLTTLFHLRWKTYTQATTLKRGEKRNIESTNKNKLIRSVRSWFKYNNLVQYCTKYFLFMYKKYQYKICDISYFFFDDLIYEYFMNIY